MKHLLARSRRAWSPEPDRDVAHAVHELRDQLLIVLGCADNLSYLIPPGKPERQLEELQRAAQRALLLTTDILVASRETRHRSRRRN